jgi:sulfate transport system permease protein
MPYISEVTSLMIFIRLQEYDYAAASAIASVILLASLVLLFAITVWQARYLKRLEGR